jgi:hypothetical protein
MKVIYSAGFFAAVPGCAFKTVAQISAKRKTSKDLFIKNYMFLTGGKCKIAGMRDKPETGSIVEKAK